jgi:glycosyltransferase involved in cell wall biosynthesis
VPSELEASVVVATHDRAARLGALLAALRAQTLPAERFEVIVVDDGSGDETAAVLERETGRGGLQLRTLRLEPSRGRAAARQRGWHEAGAPVVAFTDDDCEPSRDWLAAGLAACTRHPGAIVQGRTEPIAAELEQCGPWRRPFTRTIRVPALDPGFATCNVFYPRALLERIGGFDVEAYGRVHGGEDSDLAWRAIATGARAAFAPDALVRHAVNRLGPLGKLRFAAGWELRAYADHPGLRRAHFSHLVFWKPSHYLLARALLGLALPRRARWLAPWLVTPYLRHLLDRGRVEGGGPLLAPYFALHDLVEMATVARAALRYRTLML